MHFVRTSLRVPGGFQQHEGLPHSSIHFLCHQAFRGASVRAPAPRGAVGCRRRVGGEPGCQRDASVRMGQLRAGFSRVFPGERRFLRPAAVFPVLPVLLRVALLLHPPHLPAAVLQRAPEDPAVPQLLGHVQRTEWFPAPLRRPVLLPGQPGQKFGRVQRAEPKFERDGDEREGGQRRLPGVRRWTEDSSCRGHAGGVCTEALLHDSGCGPSHFMDANDGKEPES